MKNYLILLCFLISCTPSSRDATFDENEKLIRSLIESHLVVTDSFELEDSKTIQASNDQKGIYIQYMKHGHRMNSDSMAIIIYGRKGETLGVYPNTTTDKQLQDSLIEFIYKKYIF